MNSWNQKEQLVATVYLLGTRAYDACSSKNGVEEKDGCVIKELSCREVSELHNLQPIFDYIDGR